MSKVILFLDVKWQAVTAHIVQCLPLALPLSLTRQIVSKAQSDQLKKIVYFSLAVGIFVQCPISVLIAGHNFSVHYGKDP